MPDLLAGVQARLTAAFINADPVSIDARRRVTEPDGEGGTTGTWRRLPRWHITLCQPGSSGYGATLQTGEGRTATVDHLLVGPVGVDVRVGDEFELRGHRWRVGRVLPPNGWETRATVDRAGDAP